MRRIFIFGGITVAAAGILLVALRAALSPLENWQDRRPIGSLFLASGAHSSPTNPRGWFNDRVFDVVGPGGTERFRKRLLAYADQSISILRDTRSQGMIVWDLEGEQYPHKVTYIGDPRLATRLAPELAPVVDEFFARFRNAGFRVGLTIRPQQLVLGNPPTQHEVGDYERLLLEKIDYARHRWGVTLFYIDSNGGIRWPAERFHLHRIAASRPDILLIPEHTDIFYYSFGAPFGGTIHNGTPSSRVARLLYPHAFQVRAISDTTDTKRVVDEILSSQDIALFHAWFWSPECRVIRDISHTYHY